MNRVPFFDETNAAAEFRQLQHGGDEALGALFESYRHRLRRMIELRIDSRLSQRIDASDVLQEGFVDASSRLQEYVGEPTLPPFVWLRFLVMQRLAGIQRWHFQRQKRDPRREEPPTLPSTSDCDTHRVAHELSASMTSPSQVAQREEMAARLQLALDGMEAADREILVLRHYEELTNAEVAAELGLTVSAASKRYIRALGRLKSVTESHEP